MIVFPKCFTEFSDKNICHYSKRARTCHLLCQRPGCYHSASKTYVDTGSLNWAQFMLQWFSDSPNSLNSEKVLLYLGKTPLRCHFCVRFCLVGMKLNSEVSFSALSKRRSEQRRRCVFFYQKVIKITGWSRELFS